MGITKPEEGLDAILHKGYDIASLALKVTVGMEMKVLKDKDINIQDINIALYDIIKLAHEARTEIDKLH